MKLFKNMISVALAALMAIPTSFNPNVATVFAEENASAGTAVTLDEWVMDTNNKVGDDAVMEIADGFLHLKSSTSNGNNPGTKPAIFVNTNQFDFSKAGHFNFTMKSVSPENDRFGVYLGYNGDTKGMFLGYDAGGWFWQLYKPGIDKWYDGGRVPRPEAGVEVPVSIQWTDDHKVTLIRNNEIVFNNHDFSEIADVLGDKIAIKGGSANPQVTEVYLKDFDYTAVAKEGTTYTGKVLKPSNEAAGGVEVVVTHGDTTESVFTNNEGVFKFVSNAESATFAMQVEGCKPFASEAVALSEEKTELDAFVMTAVDPSVEVEMPADLNALKDGIGDAWEEDINNKWIMHDSTLNSICDIEGRYRRFRATPANGNGPGTKPAMFVHPKEFDFNQPGFISFDLNVDSASQSRFGLYLGYNTDKNGLFVGFDAGGWYWQKYQDGSGEWFGGQRKAVPANSKDTNVLIQWTNDHKMTLYVDGDMVFDHEPFEGLPVSNKLAVKCGTYKNEVTDVRIKNFHYLNQELKSATPITVTGKVLDTLNRPVANKDVVVNGTAVTTDANGVYTASVLEGGVDVEVAIDGYSVSSLTTYVEQDTTLADIVLTAVKEATTSKIASNEMEVEVGTTFPFVKQYKLGEKVMNGQASAYNAIKLNGTNIEVSEDNVKANIGGDKATYELHVVDAASKIDANVVVEMKVVKNELHFDITKITSNNDTVIQTVEFEDHSLVSVNSSEANANLKGAAMSSDVNRPGDEFFAVTNSMETLHNRDYMYAFVTNNDLSAGVWSNSEHSGRAVYSQVNGGSKNTRIQATTLQSVKDGNKVTRLGLASAEWTYKRVVTDTKNNVYTVDETAMPSMKVVVTGDLNGDNTVTWQDGAIAFRKIMNNPFKCEEVPELVAWRIAMNFGGQAQNPFLTTLDNVKKVALHTDGLGQSILLKGYGSEGHDSGHPDYGDIGKRIGGAKDMNFLMDHGKDYGARFGVHVNCSEMYPEAKAFGDATIQRAGENLTYGWNWIDQAIRLDGIYDVASGARAKRFQELKDQVGDRMDFIYVDVWGNGFSGPKEDGWETRKLSKTINDLGWRLGTEWGATNEYDSTFQHWATDLTYGGAQMKGENSEVIRFLRNHQKDAWVGDFAIYGGEANCPLLGGYNMMDFEGWQGRNDYDAYILNLYRYDLSTKFLQHYQVTKWEDAKPEGVNKFNPTKQITLKADPFNANSQTVVVTRKGVDPAYMDFRERTITVDGKVVLDGGLAYGAGRIAAGTEDQGTEKYLLPWVWDRVTGERVADSEMKLYHFNQEGGVSTWDLTDDFKNATKLYMYELTANGKANEKVVNVSNGQVTLDAKRNTPYVLTKNKSESIEVTWSEGMHIVDAGFNDVEASLTKNWNKEGDGNATISKSQFSNPMLTLDGEISMTQKLTDLVPNKHYAVLVGVDNRSDSKAAMTIKVDGQVVDTNYTVKSIAKNYVKAYTHSNLSATVDGTSYFQNMYAYFKAPTNGKEVTLTLSKEAGAGKVYFDDIRIVESAMDPIEKDDDGNVVVLKQNFEKSVQGLYPFVVGPVEGVEDNRIHLSELHAPFTQAGWDVKKMDDVLTKNDPNSNWSLKVNGLSKHVNWANMLIEDKLLIQTIPQNFRFEPGVTYRVKFDYQAGSNDIFAVVVGDGEYNGNESATNLKMAMGSKAEMTYEFDMVGSESGQSWFGIKSTNVEPDLQGVGGAESNFGGYRDLVIDNIEIVEIERPLESIELTVVDPETKNTNDAIHEYLVELENSGETLTAEETAYVTAKKANKQVDMYYKEARIQTKALKGNELALFAEFSDLPKQHIADLKIVAVIDGIEYELHRLPHGQKVTITLDKDFDNAEGLRVFHIVGDPGNPRKEEVEILNHDKENRKLTVASSTFSKFVVLAKEKATPEYVAPAKKTKVVKASSNAVNTHSMIPSTGDNLHVFGYSVALIGAIGLIAFVLKKMKAAK